MPCNIITQMCLIFFVCDGSLQLCKLCHCAYCRRKTGIQSPLCHRSTPNSIWGTGKRVLFLRGEDPTAAALTCCKEVDCLELRVCTEMCLSQLQSGTNTREQSMETASLLLHTKTWCKDSLEFFFFLLIPVKRNLDLSCPFATWLTHQALSQMGYSEITSSQGICQNLHLRSLWSVPSS